MDLLSIKTINEQLLLYRDLRSVKRWMTRRGLPVFRLGKNYCIRKKDFENLISNLIPSIDNDGNNSVYMQSSYTPQGKIEREVFNRLMNLTNQTTIR